MSLNDEYQKIEALESRRDQARDLMEREDFETVSLQMLSILSDGSIETYRAITELREQLQGLSEQVNDLGQRLYITQCGEEVWLNEGECISERTVVTPPVKKTPEEGEL